MSNIPISNILVSASVVDTIIALYLLLAKRGGKSIKQWYKDLGISAYSMDVLSLTFGVYIAMNLSKDIKKQILFVVLIGLIHDISFGYFLKNKKIKGPVMTIFRNYALENGFNILWVDALMLVVTLILTYFLTKNFKQQNIFFIGVLSFYIGLLVVHSF